MASLEWAVMEKIKDVYVNGLNSLFFSSRMVNFLSVVIVHFEYIIW